MLSPTEISPRLDRRLRLLLHCYELIAAGLAVALDHLPRGLQTVALPLPRGGDPEVADQPELRGVRKEIAGPEAHEARSQVWTNSTLNWRDICGN